MSNMGHNIGHYYLFSLGLGLGGEGEGASIP